MNLQYIYICECTFTSRESYITLRHRKTIASVYCPRHRYTLRVCKMHCKEGRWWVCKMYCKEERWWVCRAVFVPFSCSLGILGILVEAFNGCLSISLGRGKKPSHSLTVVSSQYSNCGGTKKKKKCLYTVPTAMVLPTFLFHHTDCLSAVMTGRFLSQDIFFYHHENHWCANHHNCILIGLDRRIFYLSDIVIVLFSFIFKYICACMYAYNAYIRTLVYKHCYFHSDTLVYL